MEVYLDEIAFDDDGDGVPDRFEYVFDHAVNIDLGLEYDLPPLAVVPDLSMLDEDTPTLYWSHVEHWISPTLDLLTAQAVIQPVIDGVSGNFPGLFFSTLEAYDTLNNGGPTATNIGVPITLGYEGEDVLHGLNWSFSPSVVVTFDVTIPVGGNVTMDQANVVIEGLAIDPGGVLECNSTMRIRGDMDVRGEAYRLGGTVEGDLLVSGIAAGEFSNFRVLGDLYNTGEIRGLRGTIEGTVHNAGILGVNGLTLLNPLGINTATLELTGALTSPDALVNEGLLIWDGGSKQGDRNVTNNGVMEWRSGVLNQASFINSTGATISATGTAAATHIVVGGIDNHGTLAYSATGDLQLNYGSSGSAHFRNHAGGVFDLQTDAGLITTGTPGFPRTTAITNDGIFRKSGGSGESVVDVHTFTNTGLIDVASGDLRIDVSAAFINDGGALSVGGGTLRIESGFIDLMGGSYTLNGGIMDFGGQVRSDGSLVFEGAGDVIFRNGVNFDTSLPNVLAVDPGITASFEAGTAFNAVIDGDLLWHGGEFQNVVLEAGSTLTLEGAGDRRLSRGDFFTNRGTVVHAMDGDLLFGRNLPGFSGNGAVLANYGAYDLRSDADFTVWDDSAGTNNTGTGTQIDNYGTFRKSGGGGESVVDVVFNNYGVLDVASGDMTFNGRFTNDGGGVQLGNGSIVFNQDIELIGGSYSLGGGRIDFNDWLRIGGSLHLQGAGQVCFNSNIIFNDYQFPGMLTIDPGIAASFTGGRIYDTIIDGDISWQGGQLHEVEILAGSTVTLEGAGDRSLGQGLPFVNYGEIVHAIDGDLRFGIPTPGFSGYGALLTNNGTYDLRSDGDFVVFDGGTAGGVTGTWAQIDNYGTFRKSGGSGESVVDVVFNNYGVLDVASGDMTFSTSFTNDGGRIQTVAESSVVTSGVATFLGASTLAGNLTAPSVSIESLRLDQAHLTVANLNVQAGDLLFGTGTVDGSVTNAGLIGDALIRDQLLITGNYVQSSGGTLVIAFGATGIETLEVGGTATLGGTLEIHVSRLAPNLAGDYRFLLAGEIVGDFESIVIVGDPHGWLSVSSIGVITVIPSPATTLGLCAAGLTLSRRRSRSAA